MGVGRPPLTLMQHHVFSVVPSPPMPLSLFLVLFLPKVKSHPGGAWLSLGSVESCYLQDVGFISSVLALLVYSFLVGRHCNAGVTIFRDDEASLLGDASF